MTVIDRDGIRGTIRKDSEDESVIILSPEKFPDEGHPVNPRDLRVVMGSKNYEQETSLLYNWLGRLAPVVSWAELEDEKNFNEGPSGQDFTNILNSFFEACAYTSSDEILRATVSGRFRFLSREELQAWLETAMVRLARARYAQEG